MLKGRINIFKRIIFVADLCLLAISFQLSFIINLVRLGENYDIFYIDNLFLPSVIIWAAVIWFHRDCYEVRLRSTRKIIKSLFEASVISWVLVLSLVFVLKFQDESRLQVAMFSSLGFLSLAAFRIAIKIFLKLYSSQEYNVQSVIIMGTNDRAKEFADKISSNEQIGWKILGFVDWDESPDNWRYQNIPFIGVPKDLPEIFKEEQVDWVFFAVSKKRLGEIDSIIFLCEQMGIQVAILADFFPTKMARLRLETLFDTPLVCYDMTPMPSLSHLLKSLSDRLLAVVGIVVFTPVMLISAFIISLSTKGPVIFKQERCGLNGRKFILYKFRTMVEDAEDLKDNLMEKNEMEGPVFKMTDDPRITRVGKFLRKSSIDELPQLFNILKGEMSLVGPRPPLPEEVTKYDLWQRRKLSMKPGLTGLWQISGRDDASFENWMKLDLKYIDEWSVWNDIKIFFKTIPAVIKGTGAK